ncbi:hypothetical protein BCR36DRAFT_585958 [Piromyces finnis]|uniref:SH3 domain-containing protein n=1 Tax=Piromyces finnis TaxID=1754191 RepID=A0A1Y1V0Z7_9FUNG|nr:hypothetical protein BCR36DRAFT_585958 [Piromyces finnis]|eukprot:ORX44845.1 hypothetical protein BCR36DRAFT_585958 [Piromyces finnis]
MNSKLNIIISLFVSCFIQFAYSELNTFLCGNCNVILECHAEFGGTGKFPIYPPSADNYPEEIETVKCYCNNENINRYKDCIKCHYGAVKLSTPPGDGIIDANCKKINNDATKQIVDTKTTKTDINNTNNQENQNIANSNMNSNISTQSGSSTMNPNSSSSSSSSSSTTPNAKKNNKDVESNDKGSDNKDDNPKSTSRIITWSVIGLVFVVGIIGFFVYNKKKNTRPESMPFYGNAPSSPNTNTLPYNPNGTLKFNSVTPTNYEYVNYNEYQYGTVNNSNNEYQYGTVNNSNNEYQYNTGDNNEHQYSTGNDNNNNEDQVNYDLRRDSMNQSSNINVASTNQNEKTYVCTYPYIPKLDDEVEIRLNDEVKIIEEFQDGWGKIYNVTTNREGMAPLVCLKQ